jgi:hypothetical protein
VSSKPIQVDITLATTLPVTTFRHNYQIIRANVPDTHTCRRELLTLYELTDQEINERTSTA